MQFKDYVMMEDKKNWPSITLNQIHKRVRNKLPNRKKKDYKDLQKFLQSAFYGDEKNNNIYYEKIKKAVQDTYLKQYDKVLKDFDMGASNVSYTSSAEQDVGSEINRIYKIARDKYEHFSHTHYIHFDTLRNRWSKIQSHLLYLKLNNFTETHNQLIKELEACAKNINELLKQYDTGSNKRLNLVGNNELLEKVKNIDDTYRALSESTGSLAPQDFGNILEWVLQSLSGIVVNDISEQDGIKLVQETVGSKKIKESRQITAPNKNHLIGVSSITKEMDEKTKKEKEVYSFTIGEGENKLTFNYKPKFDPFTSRQGKVDVIFNLPGSTKKTTPFRISAKNWQNLGNNKNFGETNAAYALIRSLEKNKNMHTYLYLMQDESFLNIEELHNLAKYSIILDILMGYSQAEGYADTVVINVREQSKVVVFSIREVLENICKNLTEINVAGYNNNDIRKNIILISNNANNLGNKFIDTSLSYLQNVDVLLHFHAIKKYIPQLNGKNI